MRVRVHLLPKTVISRYSNTYAKKSKRLGIRELPLGRLKMVISTYSNILLSVSMMNMTNVRVSCGQNGHLDCLKYLHETAKAPWDYRAVRVAHENNHPECVQYLLDNDCPLPDGWRYEGGTLYDDRNNRRGVQDRTREREKRKARLSEYAEQRDKYIDMVPETAQN